MSASVEIATAGVAILGVVGGGIKFVWSKIEARFTLIETDLKLCHEGRERDQERRATQMSVIEMLFGEIRRIAPDSWAIRRAGELMEDLRQKTQEASEGERP